MGKRFLIDTNVAIYFLDGNLTPSGIAFLQPLINQEINISVITKIELLGWNFPNLSKSEIHNEFVSQSNIFSLSEEVVEKPLK
jgi:predicted nucleic acid-binding protein